MYISLRYRIRFYWANQQFKIVTGYVKKVGFCDQQ